MALEETPIAADHCEAPGLEAAADAVAQAFYAAGAEQRLWLQEIRRFVRGRSHEIDPSKAVQTAEEMALIAAYDRAARILRSDEEPLDD